MINIGQRMKFLRVALDLKQRELAARLGITNSHLSLLERGKRMPSYPLLVRFSEVTGLPLPLLLKDKQVPDERAGELEQKFDSLIEVYGALR